MESLDNEPDPKRVTLAARAGETRSVVAATPAPKLNTQGFSLAAIGNVSIYL